MTQTPVTPELEKAAERAESRRGFLLSLPAYVYLIFFFAVPLVLVFIYSFATRSSTGQTLLQDWSLDAYKRLFTPIVGEIFARSVLLAVGSQPWSAVTTNMSPSPRAGRISLPRKRSNCSSALANPSASLR